MTICYISKIRDILTFLKESPVTFFYTHHVTCGKYWQQGHPATTTSAEASSATQIQGRAKRDLIMRGRLGATLFAAVCLAALATYFSEAAPHFPNARSLLCISCSPHCRQPCYYESQGGCKLNINKCPWLGVSPLFGKKE